MTMRRRFHFVSASWLMTMAVGCQVIAGLEDHSLVTDLSDASNDAALADETTPGFTIATLPGLAVLPGGTGTETITINRTGGFSDPVAFAVLGLPTGVTTDPLQIAANQTTGSLTFHVALSNDQSASPLTISAVSAAAVATTTMSFYVRGPSGSPDLTFGSKGEFASVSLLPTDGALDSDDNVILAGVGGTSNASFASIRILTNGVQDDKFSVAQTFAQPALAFRAFPISTGDILYAGFLTGSGGEYLRVSTTGVFDTSFSADGGAIGYFDTHPVDVFSADSTGRIFSAGNPMGTANTALFIERRAISGDVDPSFGGTYAVGSAGSTVTDSLVQPDGKLVTVSDATTGSVAGLTSFEINRFTSAGAPDSTFGSGGHVASTILTGGGRIALAPDGSFYVLTTTGVARGLFHCSSAGAPDATFGSSGELVVSASNLAVQADGKILLLSAVPIENANDSGTFTILQVERLTATGAVDTTFGTGGIVQTNADDLTGDDGQKQGAGESPVAIRVQSDGRIVVVGNVIVDVGAFSNAAIVDRFWP